MTSASPTNPLLLREIVVKVMSWIDMDYHSRHEITTKQLDYIIYTPYY